MNENTKNFYRELREARQRFVTEVARICASYGMDLVPMSFDDVFDFLSPKLSKLIDKDFRRHIERKVKNLKKKLNPLWRRIRSWFGS